MTTRSKRRTIVGLGSDENQNPFITRVERENGERKTVDEAVTVEKKACRSTRTVSAKHGGYERRIEVAPAKISAHFQVAKSAIEVFQDSKGEPTASPHTPRHRDALSKKVPITPRHRALASQLTPRTPKLPSTPSNATVSVYSHARQLFSRCSSPGKIVGRDAERQELSTFVNRCLDSKSGGCLYVSGPPGTGKSALVDDVSQEFKSLDDVKLATVNCMSVRTSKNLSRKLLDGLDLKDDTGFEFLRSCFLRDRTRDSQQYVLVLDEVDRLVDLDLDLLYALFEWSMQPTSRLVLIGIANALDLTDRFLPRLKARNLKPELLPFMPYTAKQIAEVLTSKLKSLSTGDEQTVPLLHPAAIQFCAKKVAAQTGDLRKAFDICRRAIDLVELETRERDAEKALQESPSKTPLMENINLSAPSTPHSATKKRTKSMPAVTYTPETAPKATIAHMAKVTAQAFANGTTQRLSTLNLQQKVVLCALAALEKRKRETQLERTMFATPSKSNSTAPSVKQLFEAYSSLCKHEKLLHPLSSVEFRDVVSGLEALSLVSAVDGKNGSLILPITPSRTPSKRGRGGFGAAVVGDERRVASVVGYKELAAGLEGAGAELLRDILDGGALL